MSSDLVPGLELGELYVRPGLVGDSGWFCRPLWTSGSSSRWGGCSVQVVGRSDVSGNWCFKSGLRVSGRDPGCPVSGLPKRPRFLPSFSDLLFVTYPLLKTRFSCSSDVSIIWKNPRAFSLRWVPCYQKLLPALGHKPLRLLAPVCPCPSPGHLQPWPCSWQASEAGPTFGRLAGWGRTEAGYFLTFLYQLLRNESTG